MKPVESRVTIPSQMKKLRYFPLVLTGAGRGGAIRLKATSAGLKALTATVGSR